MSVALLDERKYRELLDGVMPVFIRTEEEYRRLLGAVEAIMEQPEGEISEAVFIRCQRVSFQRS